MSHSITSFLLPTISLTTVIALISQRKHLLMALLALEAVILSIILLLTLSLSPTNPTDTILILILLTFAATEASLGLACLVNMIRLKGTDMMKSTTSVKT